MLWTTDTVILYFGDEHVFGKSASFTKLSGRCNEIVTIYYHGI